MKKTLIALICLAAFSSESFSQKVLLPVSIIKPVTPRPLYAYEYLNVPLPFKLTQGKVIAELYNTDGKAVITAWVTGPIVSMYTGDLPAGIYELRISWKGGSISYTVIKNYTR